MFLVCFMIICGCMDSILVACMLNIHLTAFLFGFEATKSLLDGLHAQQPLFMSIYNEDIIGMDWNVSIGTSLRVSLRVAFPGHMHVDSDEEVWGL